MKTREQKRKEAETRQARRNGRTNEQQIELLKNRMGSSSKEINRLQIQINLDKEIAKQAKEVK